MSDILQHNQNKVTYSSLSLNHTGQTPEGQDYRQEVTSMSFLTNATPQNTFFTEHVLKIAESRDLIEKVSQEPNGRKDDELWFRLEEPVETHQMPDHDDSNNQTAPTLV